jgi:hypothetical protein
MFNYEYRSETTPGRVCLEISLKPFGYDKSPAGIEAVARHLLCKTTEIHDEADRNTRQPSHCCADKCISARVPKRSDIKGAGSI